MLQHAKLQILATTDLHAHITNYDYYRDAVLDDFGLIGIADLINKMRAKSANTLLVDNGDYLQGSPIGNYLCDYAIEQMHPIVRVMNEMQYDVGTLGNHEFDFGIEFLEKMMADTAYPLVNANIVTEDGQTWIDPYIILERNLIMESGQECPIKVGIIGILPPQVTMWNYKIFADYANEHPALSVKDSVQAIQYYVPKMKAAGADIIIVLAHSGFSKRVYAEGAENVVQFLADIEGIDAIIAGHAHSVFPDDTHHFDVPIVMPGSFGKYLGVIDLSLSYDEGWNVDQSTTSVIANESFDQLKAPLFDVIKEAHELTKERMNAPIVENKTVFSSALSLIQDDPCTQLIADAQFWYAKQLLRDLGIDTEASPILSAVPPFKVGGRKNAPYDFTWIDEGLFTFRNVADLYPFNNQLALIEITGAMLKEWLECANSIYYQIDEECDARQYLINWEKHRSYNRDVIKGVEYCVDVRYKRRYNGDCVLINPDSERIYDLTYQGQAIHQDDLFILATNQYRAYSGKFPGSGEERVLALSSDEIPMIIEQYLLYLSKAIGMIDIVAENNWQLIIGSAENIIYETSPAENDFSYIAEKYNNINFIGEYDEQKFALYNIRSANFV